MPLGGQCSLFADVGPEAVRSRPPRTGSVRPSLRAQMSLTAFGATEWFSSYRPWLDASVHDPANLRSRRERRFQQ